MGKALSTLLCALVLLELATLSLILGFHKKFVATGQVMRPLLDYLVIVLSGSNDRIFMATVHRGTMTVSALLMTVVAGISLYSTLSIAPEIPTTVTKPLLAILLLAFVVR